MQKPRPVGLLTTSWQSCLSRLLDWFFLKLVLLALAVKKEGTFLGPREICSQYFKACSLLITGMDTVRDDHEFSFAL